MLGAQAQREPYDRLADPQRRYRILLAVLAQSATDVLDEVMQLFDQAITALGRSGCLPSRSRSKSGRARS
jgi:hypothetical protein